MQTTCMQKDFVKALKKLGEYNDLYLKSDRLFLTYVFEKIVFKNLSFRSANIFQLLDYHGKHF